MHTFLSILTLVLLTLFNSLSAAPSNRDSQIDNQRKTFIKSLLSPDTEVDDELFAWFLDKQNERINELTQAIHEQNNLTKQISLLNERGTVYFFTGEFESAINDFSYVIDKTTTQLPEEETLLGTALWGRMLCYAFGGQVDNTYNDCRMITALFTECSCDKDHEKEEAEVPFVLTSCNDRRVVLPIAKFAYPEEVVSRWECHDRVKTITSKAHTLAKLIPDFLTEEATHRTIDWVTKKAHECCDSPKHWTECLESIIDVWKNLQNGWEELVELFKKGIDLRLFLTTPLNG